MNTLFKFFGTWCLVFSLPFFGPCLWGQSTYFVNVNVPGGNEDGSSWEHAFPDLRDALDVAFYGDQIWVAEGVYFPTDGFIRDVGFHLKNGVKMFGGFNGTEAALTDRDWELHPTILSGDIGIPGDSTDNSFSILLIGVSDTTTQVDGFVFRGGVANGLLGDENSPAQSGGAIHIDGGSGFAFPRIHHCRFENNFARFDGGAVFAGGSFWGSFAPQFHNCVFTTNRCGRNGASIARMGGSETEIKNDFSHCLFQNNQAGHDGGGVFIQEFDISDTIEFTDCNFMNNTAVEQGAGISIWGSTTEGSKILVKNCEFDHNSATNGEGVDFHYIGTNLLNLNFLDIDHCLFHHAQPSTHESIYVDGLNVLSIPSFVRVKNCTFKDNQITPLTLLGYNWDSLVIENNLIENNTANGTMVHWEGTEICRIVNNSFVGNAPSAVNPTTIGVFSGNFTDHITFANNILFDNLLRYDGLLRTSGIDTLTNCLIWNRLDTTTNDIPFGDLVDTFNIYVRNSIIIVDELFGSFETLGATHIYLENTAITSATCPVLPGPIPPTSDPNHPFVFCGNGVLFDPLPLLADTAAGNYALAHCSPARNAGENSFLANLNLGKDFLNKPRILEATVDMGPFETPPFDLDIDNVTDISCDSGTEAGTLIINAQSACAPFVLSFGDTAIMAGTSPITIENLPAGHYEITLTDAQGRTDQVSADIIIPAPLTVEALPSSEVDCETGTGVNATAVYSGGAGKVAYLWSTGSSSAWILDQPIGTYAITVTDALGCTAVDTFEITANGSLEILGEAQNTNCPGGTDGSAAATSANGNPPFVWLWENALTDSTLSNLPSGTYAVTITDANGCSGEAAIEIMEPAPIETEAVITHSTSTSAPDGAIAVTQTTGGTPGYSYEWDTGETTPSIANLPPGEYSLTVTDAAGCSQVFTYTVELHVATSQVLGGAIFEIFPNPVSAGRQIWLRSEVAEAEVFTASLFDIYGRAVFAKNISPTGGLSSFEMPKVAGTYLFVLENEKGDRAIFRVVAR